MLKTEAIQKFLHKQPYAMGKLYNPNMEVQVNVARDTGEPIQGSYAGLRWQGFTDGLQIWKHFRIPWNAGTDPKYEDKDIKFDISIHAEAIGMTGWDYVNKRSLWVGFDFDSLIGHKEGLTKDELDTIKQRIYDCDFVTIFTSTSGNGLHLYCFIEDQQTIANHNEHAAVARAILSKIAGLTGLDLEAKVDTLGGNIWVWHRKCQPDKSFRILREASAKTEIPLNWRDYLNQKKVIASNTQTVDNIIASRNRVTLDDDHIKLLKWFEKGGATTEPPLWWFNDEKQMLVCHTHDLKLAHQALNLAGFFDTVATGKDHGRDQNCFCFPVREGGWTIRRHTKGVKEHISWFVDSSGWTTSYYNKRPNLRVAASLSGGIEGEKGYSFRTLTDAIAAIRTIGLECDMPAGMSNRPSVISELKDGRYKISFDAYEHDEQNLNWARDAKGKRWERYFFRPRVVDDLDAPDHFLRQLTSDGVEIGFFLLTNNNWIEVSRSNAASALVSIGYRRGELEPVFGACALNNWKLVNKPFELEYPGNREWNKNAAQYRFVAKRGKHPTWDSILEHCGRGLGGTLLETEWSKDAGLINGLLYLQAWLAACCQFPFEPTPYLFLYGPQNSGKSIFHEAISLLFTKGYIRADSALTNPSGFNGELAGAIFCIVEETNLSKKGWAPERIKDWVTGRTISIHTKGKTPYDIANCTHWIQCSNQPEYCPVLPGDTRITMIKVEKPKADIPKAILLERLELEAEAFVHTILSFDLPERVGRLRLPIIETEQKKEEMRYNRNQLEVFIEENVYDACGYKIKLSDFYSRFNEWLEPRLRDQWTVRRVAKECGIIKGKHGIDGQIYLGNVSFEAIDKSKLDPLVKVGDRLTYG